MKKKDKDIEIQLLLQAYSRYVSRAHTIFEAYFNVISLIVFSNIGLMLSLIQTRVIPLNKFYVILLFIIDIIISIIVTIVALLVWYDSRRKRIAIVREIKSLNNTQYNQPKPSIAI